VLTGRAPPHIFDTVGARDERPSIAHFSFAATDSNGGESMAIDYDALRPSDIVDDDEDSLQELAARRSPAQSLEVDVDESEAAESFELPGADLSDEELSVRVIPMQRDEFTCSSCFLVQHRSRLASHRDGVMICRDCAG